MIAVLHQLGQHDFLDLLDDFAAAAQATASTEVELVSRRNALDEEGMHRLA